MAEPWKDFAPPTTIAQNKIDKWKVALGKIEQECATPAELIDYDETGLKDLLTDAKAPARLQSQLRDHWRTLRGSLLRPLHSSPLLPIGTVIFNRSMIGFSKEKYEQTQYSFPSLDRNDHLRALYGRETQMAAIEKTFARDHEKWRPVVIATSRGMGKTTLMKRAAMLERFKPAAAVGRLLSYDCSGLSEIRDPLGTLEMLRTHWWGVMVARHICVFFSNCTYLHNDVPIKIEATTDGVLAQLTVRSPKSPSEEFMAFIVRHRDPFRILQQVTNFFFEVQDDTLPLVLLDNIQFLGSISLPKENEKNKLTTMLSRVLVDAATKITSFNCIAAGTSDGRLKEQAEGSNYVPKFISLPILDISDAWKVGQDLLDEQQKKYHDCEGVVLPEYLKLVGDHSTPDQITMLVMLYLSCQIPRLVVIAWRTLIRDKTNKLESGKDTWSRWEKEVREYYTEASDNFKTISTEAAAVLILACNVNFTWPAKISDELVYEQLMDQAIIFPYLSGVCVLPSVLLPKDMREIDKEIEKLVPGVRRRDLQLSIRDYLLFEGNLKSAADDWENYITCSLAVRGFLHMYTTGQSKFRMKDVYTVTPGGFVEGCFELLGQVNFCGVERPKEEVTWKDDQNPQLIYINEKTHNAHHDSVIYSASEKYGFNAAIQAKSSLAKPTASAVERQLIPLNGRGVLLWFYLDAPEIEKALPVDFKSKIIQEASKNSRVAFLNGNGCLSPLLIDNLFFLKKFNKIVEKIREGNIKDRALSEGIETIGLRLERDTESRLQSDVDGSFGKEEESFNHLDEEVPAPTPKRNRDNTESSKQDGEKEAKTKKTKKTKKKKVAPTTKKS